jgi:hypothetical protein
MLLEGTDLEEVKFHRVHARGEAEVRRNLKWREGVRAENRGGGQGQLITGFYALRGFCYALVRAG